MLNLWVSSLLVNEIMNTAYLDLSSKDYASPQLVSNPSDVSIQEFFKNKI